MKKQFRHEHHVRQDKAKKVDYHSDMLPSTFPSDATDILINRGLSSKSARDSELRKISRLFYGSNGRVMRRGWKLDDFASKNCLDPSLASTSQLFLGHKAKADHDHAAITAAIQKAEVKTTWHNHGAFQIRYPTVNWKVNKYECDEVYYECSGSDRKKQIVHSTHVPPWMQPAEPVHCKPIISRIGERQFEVTALHPHCTNVTTLTSFECPLCRKEVRVRARIICKTATEARTIHRAVCDEHCRMEHPNLK